MTYEESGVKDVKLPDTFTRNIEGTFGYSQNNQPRMGLGFFANVVGDIAITTDGVGSKIEIARLLGDYSTIGVDCVAMNVNDLLCVGARPISMVDYIATNNLDYDILDQISVGLNIGAQQAGISISGGEIAQLPDLMNGVELSGTAIGIMERPIIDGSSIRGASEAIIGLYSSGIHSNGITLARKVLNVGPEYLPNDEDTYLRRLLLRPTRIYVKPILGLMDKNINILGMAHITGGGWKNLLRLKTQVDYNITRSWKEPEIFERIRKTAKVHTAERFKTFNMGIGFILIVPKSQKDKTTKLLESYGIDNVVLGHCTASKTSIVKISNADYLLEIK